MLVLQLDQKFFNKLTIATTQITAERLVVATCHDEQVFSYYFITPETWCSKIISGDMLTMLSNLVQDKFWSECLFTWDNNLIMTVFGH